MRVKQFVLGVVAALVLAVGVASTPVGAQQIMRIYGTVSGAPIALLANSSGVLRVSLDGGSIPASTCAAPALSLSGGATTGIAFTATPSILNCIAGVAVTTLTGSSFTSSVPFIGPAGTAVATSFNFGTPGTGLFGDATSLNFSVSGVNRFQVYSGGLSVLGGTVLLGSAEDVLLSRFAAGVAQFTRTALGTTSSTGLQLVNTTAATVGTPVQISPRFLQRGTAWDTSASQTVDFFTEVLPATAATPTGTWKLGYSLNGAAATYPLTVGSNGQLTVLNELRAGTDVGVGSAFYLYWSGRLNMSSPGDGLLNTSNSTATIGIQINTGTAEPTVTSCGTGTVTSGARNTTGQITATGATTCTITFGAPAWTNAPFCTITPNAAPTTVPYINGDPSTTAFVVAGLTAGDNLKFSYLCIGRI